MNQTTTPAALDLDSVIDIAAERCLFERTYVGRDFSKAFTFEGVGEYASPTTEALWRGFLKRASLAAAPAPYLARRSSSAAGSEQDERALFEAWAPGNVTSLVQGKFGTGYVYADTISAWKAWQARAAIAQRAASATADLHNAIMNMPCKPGRAIAMNGASKQAYQEGHRVARHAAAELALTQQAAPEAPASAQPTDLREALHELVHTQRKLIDANAEIAMLRLSSAQPVAAAPAGWKLVPLEPTEYMREAAASFGHPGALPYPEGYSSQRGSEAVNSYRHMLAAAPAAPVAQACAHSWHDFGQTPDGVSRSYCGKCKAMAITGAEEVAPVAQATTASASIGDDAGFRELALDWFQNNMPGSFEKLVAYIDGRAPAPSREAAPLDVETLWEIHGMVKNAGSTRLAHKIADAIAQGASQDAAANAGEVTDVERLDALEKFVKDDGYLYLHDNKARGDLLGLHIGFKGGLRAALDGLMERNAPATSAGASLGQAGADDAALLDWLNEQTVDIIYLDDFTKVDVRGNDVRAAIRAAIAATTAKESSAKAGAERGEA